MSSYGVTLASEALNSLAKYFEVLSAWNSRLHLVSFRSPEEFATRHVLESLLLLKYLPPDARVGDVGSGGGLPIIPCLIARHDVQAFLIESSKKKAIFLREALSVIGLANGSVIAERFEHIDCPPVDVVSGRAVEKFERLIEPLTNWAPANVMFALFGGQGLKGAMAAAGLDVSAILIPNSEQRFLFVGQSSVKDS